MTINGGSNRAFLVDPGVTANISGLTIQSGFVGQGAGLEVSGGTANVTNCFFTQSVLKVNSAMEVLGGTLTVDGSVISGWWVGIHVAQGASATITSDTITHNQYGIIVGLNANDDCSVSSDHLDLSNNAQYGIVNVSPLSAVNATLNWWGSSSGPNTPGTSRTFGTVNFSPWLGDTQSLDASKIPDALGFIADNLLPPLLYQVVASSTSSSLIVNSAYQVTPNGTIAFYGSGSKVTIIGESGSDSFSLTTRRSRSRPATPSTGPPSSSIARFPGKSMRARGPRTISSRSVL